MSNITNFNFNGAEVRQPMHRDIGFVYVVEDAASGRVKIGMSRAPDRRVKAVRSSAGIAGGRNHISVRVKNARAVEAAVHLALSGSRLQGEFFGCGFDEAVSAVQAMAESDAADDDYTAARKLEQQERGRSICDGVKRLVCEWSPPSPVSDQQKSRIVHARNFAAVTNSTLGDFLRWTDWGDVRRRKGLRRRRRGRRLRRGVHGRSERRDPQVIRLRRPRGRRRRAARLHRRAQSLTLTTDGDILTRKRNDERTDD